MICNLEYRVMGNLHEIKHLQFIRFAGHSRIFSSRGLPYDDGYCKRDGHCDCLPAPCGPLSSQLPCGSIKEAIKKWIFATRQPIK